MAYRTFVLKVAYPKFDGQAAKGTVEIEPSVPVVVDAAGNRILSGKVVVKLDDYATADVTLPDPSDETLNPVGWGFTVTANLHHGRLAPVSFGADQIVDGVVELAKVTTVDPATFDPVTTYATATEVNALGTRVATLEESPGGVTSYLELTDKPTIPTTAEDVGALPAAEVDTQVATLAQDPLSETGQALSATIAAQAAGRRTTLAPRAKVGRLRSEWATTFAPGHGWTADGTYSTFEDVALDPVLGSGAVRIVNGTASASTGVGKTGLTAIDATDKVFVAWIKTPDLSRLASIHLLAGDGNFSNYFTLRTWLSGAALKPTTNNRWTPIYFTFNSDAIASSGSPNRAAITAVKLRFFAHTNATTTDPLDVTVGGVGVAPDASAVYPNGVVTFTFDDGYDDQLTAGKTYLDKYGFPATLYTIVEQVGAANRLSLDQLKEMQRSGWEIAGHAYTENAHTNRLTSLTDAELDAEMANLKAWLRDNGFDSDNYCYPGGVFADREIEVVSRYFSTGRTTSTQPTHSLVPPPDPMMITQYDPASGGASALANAKTRIDKAIADKSWVQLMIHNIGVGGISEADFQGLVDYCHTSGIAVRTVQEVITASVAEPVVAVASEGGGGEPAASNVQTAYKVSDTTRNNTSTRAADPHLTIPVEANATYLVEGFLAYVATTTADFAIRFEGPGGSFPTMRWSPAALVGTAISSTSAVNKSAYSNIPLTLGADGGTGGCEARPMGYVTIGGTAGNFVLTWAQGTAEVSDTTLLAGSWLRLTKVA